MNIVIGLCGESSVGKTAVAKALAVQLGAEVRHCGEIVKARANQLGVEFSQLPDHEHVTINSETRKLALEARGIVVMEGRFLDRFLGDVPNVLLIRLECSDEERLRRSTSKLKALTLETSKRTKNTDSGEVLHGVTRGKGSQIKLKTDGLTVDQVKIAVLEHFERFLNDTP